MRLTTATALPLELDRVFSFFAHADNLQKLTPDWLHFSIRTPLPIAMQQGTTIDYRIRLRGLPLTWRSEITLWEPPRVFVDTQVRGPYRRWIHTHRFTATDGGTLMDDLVEFDVLGGRLAGWFVGRDLRAIFSYRHQALRRALDLGPAPAPSIVIA